ILSLLYATFAVCCTSQQKKVDLLLYNCKILSASTDFSDGYFVAVNDGKIVSFGNQTEFEKWQVLAKNKIDLQGNYLYPGFIEGHGHFIPFGNSLMTINLSDTKNWEEVIDAVHQKIKVSQNGAWVEGRGWHQEKWNQLPKNLIRGYPTHSDLSAVSTNNPVVLYHASGHALFANKQAMDLAGVSKETKDPVGGLIVRDNSGNPTGVFEENAMDIITNQKDEFARKIDPEANYDLWKQKALLAQAQCIENGITSFQDAGTSIEEIAFYKRFIKEGNLKIRISAMIYDSLQNIKTAGLPIIDYGNNFLTIRAIKTYIDGALGSYGAWLLQPYTDKPNFTGQNTTSLDTLRAYAEFAKANNLQLCTHAIGDKANREVLNIYEAVLAGDKSLRWRIEHAQHIHPSDVPRFAKLGVIPSMQAIHCTSDAPFVAKRLGDVRAQDESYLWNSLWQSGALMANGTDVPVEGIQPILNFYSTVTRKNNNLLQAFYPEQCLSRKNALLSITQNNAYASLEETKKGSIKVGGFADFTVLDTDLINCSEDRIKTAKIIRTIVNGVLLK
ncbi:MAG: amidohydrolase, partial [Saprospiraceae bacterium]|nr:amidohydrolase [Saprospiraceae bacterium]